MATYRHDIFLAQRENTLLLPSLETRTDGLCRHVQPQHGVFSRQILGKENKLSQKTCMVYEL